MNSNNPCIAAAMATIEVLEAENTHDKLFALGKRLMDGIREAARASGQNLRVQGMGPMFHTGFSDLECASDYRDTLAFDKAKGGKFVAGLQERGIRVYNKTGDIGIAYADAALIELPNGHRAVAAFMVKGPFNDPRSANLIRAMAAAMAPKLIQPANKSAT